MKTKTEKLTFVSIMISLALILSYFESLIPAFTAIPGIKVGLANIAVVFVLYKIGIKPAFLVSLAKVFLSCLLFGSFVSFIYSFSGAIVSLSIMAIMKKTGWFSTIGVSICGAVLHNLAQILTACLIIGTGVIIYYIPVLVFTGVLAGITIGIISSVLVKRIKVDF